MDVEKFGQTVKNYRSKKNINQKDFAKIVGCSPSQLSKIEAGKSQAKLPIVFGILNTMIPDFKLKLLEIEFGDM